MVSDPGHLVNPGPGAPIPEPALARLRHAASRGRVCVPVLDSKQESDGLHLGFLLVPDVTLDAATTRSLVAVFTSVDAMVASGLPAAMPHGSPLVEDLAALLGPETWVLVDPASEGALSLPVAALVGLCHGMRERETPQP
jgi:hypothetical protein